MAAIKILMADDEPAVLEIMARRIADSGFDVIKASNGLEAWEKIQKENPDIVLLDLTMPQMDGYSVLSKLRSSPPSKKWIPVIIISATGEMQNIQNVLNLQADHYLMKPCKLEDIIKAIQVMMALIPLRNP